MLTALAIFLLFVLFMACLLVPRIMFPLVALVFGGIILASCAQLGISQSENEQIYTTAAVAGDVTIITGKVTGDIIDQICKGDNAAYTILVSTRNPADGVKSYAPADNAHKKLQNDGVKFSGDCTAIP